MVSTCRIDWVYRGSLRKICTLPQLLWLKHGPQWDQTWKNVQNFLTYWKSSLLMCLKPKGFTLWSAGTLFAWIRVFWCYRGQSFLSSLNSRETGKRAHTCECSAEGREGLRLHCFQQMGVMVVGKGCVHTRVCVCVYVCVCIGVLLECVLPLSVNKWTPPSSSRF